MLLNDETSLRLARAFAGRVVSGSSSANIARAYRLAFGRRPDAEEVQLAREFLERDATLARGRMERHQRLALPDPAPPGLDPAEGAALVDFCQALMNTNEFVYVD